MKDVNTTKGVAFQFSSVQFSSVQIILAHCHSERGDSRARNLTPADAINAMNASASAA